jgi:phosphate:Na+ symporter
VLLFSIFLEVVGGLGIFLLGMKNMSEGVQAIAGPRMRSMINMATSNRFMAVGMGTLVTCMVQSSSITTVMVVGLANISMMNLSQSLGVIMGANIGTTITGWILVLKIGKYGLPILGFAALFFLFSKRERWRFVAMGVMGLGMVFFGLELMKNGFKPLRDEAGFVEWFSKFSPDSYFGVLKTCLAGALLTAIVQSSSATLGITIGLATAGIIDYSTAAALVLGENIGTTVTAYLASIGGTVNARRASFAHIFFNIIGVAWITAMFPLYTGMIGKYIEWRHGGLPDAVNMADGVQDFPYITEAIAATHTGFNIANVLLFLPLMGIMVTMLKRLVPDKTGAPGHLTYFDMNLIDTPALSLQQSQREIFLMSDGITMMMDRMRPMIAGEEPDEAVERKIFNREEVLDVVQKEINEFLSHVLAGSVTQDVIDTARSQLRMADEYESISDYIVTILKLTIKLRKEDCAVSDTQRAELLDLHDHVTTYIALINDAVRSDMPDVILKARTQGEAITHLMKEYRDNHMERLSNRESTPLESLAITDMLNAYRRIKDHALNIAEVVAGEK